MAMRSVCWVLRRRMPDGSRVWERAKFKEAQAS